MYNETKVKSLLSQIKSGKINKDLNVILSFLIDNQDLCCSMITVCEYLNMPEKTASARLSELQDLGVIEVKLKARNRNYYIYQPKKKNRFTTLTKEKKLNLNNGRKEVFTNLIVF